MRKKHYIIIATLIGFLWCHEGLCASDRVALVIGNKDYQDAPLKNPVNDANDLSDALGRLGFDVIKKTNLNHQEMERSLDEFRQKIEPGGVALFYFSGHGVQVDGTNYLLPVGQTIYGPEEIKFKSVEAELVLAKMKFAGSKVNIVILDACRNNPFKGFRGSQGLTAMDAEGAFIAYATAPGRFASDNQRGRNGLYTKNLLETLKMPGLLIEELFKKVGAKVKNESGGRQLPWTSSQLYGNFYFIPPASTKPQSTVGKYIDNRDGTITDTETGLMWKRCLEGLSGVNCEKGGAARGYTWNDAVKRFKNVEYAGYSDWRLPTIDELKTLAYCSEGKDNFGDCNHGSYRPTINQRFFPNTAGADTVSGSSFGRNPYTRSWDFHDGLTIVHYQEYSGVVRLVRGGKPPNNSHKDPPDTTEKTKMKYTNNGDGTITDTETGLMWKRCSEGLSGEDCNKGRVRKYTLPGALKRFKNVEYAGYTDWRMPTVDEMKTLLYCSNGKIDGYNEPYSYSICKDGHNSEKLTINQQAFPNTYLFYFSIPSPSDNFNYVNFEYGGAGIHNDYNGYAIRLVRGGQ